MNKDNKRFQCDMLNNSLFSSVPFFFPDKFKTANKVYRRDLTLMSCSSVLSENGLHLDKLMINDNGAQPETFTIRMIINSFPLYSLHKMCGRI